MINLRDDQMILMLNICSVVAIGHLFSTYIGGDIGRYQGTSSNAITYANLCALLFIICIYYYFIKKHHTIYLLLSGLVFLSILVITQTRGPLLASSSVLYILSF